MLDKTYQPAEVEAKHYQAWEEAGAFAADPQSGAIPYTIMMPPPNVTGSLHMGHALTFTLQDVLTRYHRMRGRDALWQPGTDHAGIATQMVVERNLAAQGMTRHDLGREAFVAKIWEWKAESGGTITRQLRRLGASPDWPRERFTMDEGLNRAVRKVFVELYRQGLIYRAKRLVNWDPKLHTAISDLEVVQKEVKSHLWHFRYPLADDPSRFIVVATTRPETLLGDTAVAVHPDDERYQDLIGKHVILPLVGRRIPIIADSYADPATGSGAVKITPAHDFNDFAVGQRHNLELINVLDRDARLTDDVPEPFRGLDRFVARARIVAALEALELVATIEPHTHMVPHGDRSDMVIEPWLTDQWFCDAATLAGPALEAVETGRTVFVPKSWENTYYEWMRNIQPWCISRQIWWGHQIPAWYGPDGTVFVEETPQAAHKAAAEHYGRETELVRDTDVLDTWFSSALWPFSTLGWPEATPELRRYYPSNVLVTGFDIIFFWVARMMMMGLHFMKDVPFRTVYIHALVRDERGQKMSKSKGNVMDPNTLIDRYGCDALRFTLCSMAAQGRDLKLSEHRVEGYRNFATKLWNAARYCQMNACTPAADFTPAALGQTVNRWIVSETIATADRVAEALENYRFNEAANLLYQFTWGLFCDWYLEFTKPILTGSDSAAAAETRATTAWVLDRILHLLHPLMPFITEELWRQLGTERGHALIRGAWPHGTAALRDPAASAEMNWVIRLVSAVRTVRNELNVASSAPLALQVREAGPLTTARLETHHDILLRLARLSAIACSDAPPPHGAVPILLDEATLVLPLAGLVDLEAEKARLKKELDKLAGDIAKIDQKLGNPQFLERAPDEVVDEQRERRTEAEAARQRLEEALSRLG